MLSISLSQRTRGSGLVRGAVALVVLWRRRRRTRRHLARLDARLLDDVGIDPKDRDREIAKWFWQS
ncbi:MAG: DUF1127 domain-containing protein [Pseudomonadota bacterium]